MRKFLISAALAASTLAIAAPASAQWQQPVPQGYGYNGHNGYNGNYGQVRNLQVRVDQLQRQIAHMDRRNTLSNREARSLMNDSYQLERRIRSASRNGLNWNEQRDLQYRIARLEQRIYREARDGNRNRYGQYSYNDRDRDGVHDRYDRSVDRDRDGRDDRRGDRR